MRERRAEVRAHPGRIREIVMDGSTKASVIARDTMERVREAVGLAYR